MLKRRLKKCCPSLASLSTTFSAAAPPDSEVSDSWRTGVAALWRECSCSCREEAASGEFLSSCSVRDMAGVTRNKRWAVVTPMKSAAPTAAPKANCVTDPITNRPQLIPFSKYLISTHYTVVFGYPNRILILVFFLLLAIEHRLLSAIFSGSVRAHRTQ